jgi:protein tyrosine phosphatase (PTP) superfamily phosphohydrolase (DUF442 family)
MDQLMSAEEIYNYRKVNNQLITGGQPTEAQLRAAAAEGCTHVINLATINPRYSLPDEDGLARSLGMGYTHIPVDWGNPTLDDFDAFEKTMQQLPEGKTLIHCAANFRVTAFYGLYAMKHLGWSETQADELRAPIWQGSDYPVWERFIRQMKDRILSDPPEPKG